MKKFIKENILIISVVLVFIAGVCSAYLIIKNYNDRVHYKAEHSKELMEYRIEQDIKYSNPLTRAVEYGLL